MRRASSSTFAARWSWRPARTFNRSIRPSSRPSRVPASRKSSRPKGTKLRDFRNAGKVRSLLFSSFKTLDPLVLQHWRSFLIVCSEVIRLCRCHFYLCLHFITFITNFSISEYFYGSSRGREMDSGSGDPIGSFASFFFCCWIEDSINQLCNCVYSGGFLSKYTIVQLKRLSVEA